MYNEGLPRFGNRNGLVTRFSRLAGQSIVWRIGDLLDGRDWQSAQLQQLERPLPHVHRLVVIRQALATSDTLGSGLAGLLDNDRIGVVQLDRG